MMHPFLFGGGGGIGVVGKQDVRGERIAEQIAGIRDANRVAVLRVESRLLIVSNDLTAASTLRPSEEITAHRQSQRWSAHPGHGMRFGLGRG